MRILIIEDEPPAAKQLAKLLKTCCPAHTLLDTLDSVESAVTWLNNFPEPDLIFMDIQIADGLSFDIFRHVKVHSPVIFTTAFDQYAVQAFKVNAVDYLLKPIDQEDLNRAVQKVTAAKASNSLPDLQQILQQFQGEPRYKDRFLVKSGQHFIMLSTTDIAYFQSSGGLTMAHTFTGKKHFVEYTLDELEKLSNPSAFYRINRGNILNINSIKIIHPHLNGRLKLDIQPNPGEEIFVSRERVAEFKTWLGG